MTLMMFHSIIFSDNLRSKVHKLVPVTLNGISPFSGVMTDGRFSSLPLSGNTV